MPISAVLIGINSKGIVNDSGVVHLADGGSDTAVDSSVFPPVSYTHLDVYKRQQLRCVPALPEWSPCTPRQYCAVKP